MENTMDNIIIFISIYSISLFFLLLAEYKSNSLLRGIFKTLTSSLFLGFSFWIVYQSQVYSFWVISFLTALFLGWLGDLLLIPESNPKIFKLGVLAFLLGHFGYIVSFFSFNWNWNYIIGGSIICLISMFFIFKWLWKSIPANFKIIVVSYIIIISLMVITSLGAAGGQNISTLIIPGSILFYISDISVAKSRFVDGPSFKNRIWGLPTYFYGQLLFILALKETLNI